MLKNRRRAAPRQSPASRPLPGAGGEGLRPPPPWPRNRRVTLAERQCENRGGRDGAAPTRPHPPVRQIHTGGGGLTARGENFTPREKSGNMSSQAPLRVPQHDRRGDARLHVLVCNINLSAGTPSSIDYQYTSMPTGAKKGSPDHVRTRRALRGCRQPGEEAGGRAGRRRAAPRQGPASHPLPGAYRLPGAIQSRRREAPTRRHPAARQIHTWGGGLARGENFTPWSRCQKMAEFQKNCRGACGKKKKRHGQHL